MAPSNLSTASWSEPGNLRQAYADALEGAEAAFGPVAEGLDAASNTLSNLIEILSIVDAALADDPIAGIMGIVGEAYTNLINDFLNTDIYVLPIAPKKWSDLLHPYDIEAATDDVVYSLSDHMDPNVPANFSEGSAFVSITLLVGADNWLDFRRILKDFSELFSADQLGKWGRLADIRFQFDKYRRKPVPRAERGSQGIPWDWYRTDWMTLVPPIGNALQELAGLADNLMGLPMGVGHALQDLVRVLQERARYVQQILEDVRDLIDFLRRLQEILPKLAVLGIYGNGGTQAYANAIKNAANKPPYKLTAGVTLFFGTGDPVAQYNIMTRLLGMRVAGIENAARQLENQ